MVEVEDQWMNLGLSQEWCLVDFQLCGKQAGAPSKLLSVFCFCVYKEITHVKTFHRPKWASFCEKKTDGPKLPGMSPWSWR